MIGTYYEPYCQGAARIPMPGILPAKRNIGLSDDLSVWELLKLGEIEEAFRKFAGQVFPQMLTFFLAGALIFFMLLISLQLRSVVVPKPKPDPVIIYPKVLVVEKKEVTPVPKPTMKPRIAQAKNTQVKIKRVKKRDIPKKNPIVKAQPPEIVRKVPLRSTQTAMVEKKLNPEIKRSAIEKDMYDNADVPTPIRSGDFSPAKSLSSATIERGPRPAVSLDGAKTQEGVQITTASVRSKRDGLPSNMAYSDAGPRNEMNMTIQGGSQGGDIHIEGVSLASLEACPNPLDEVELKKKILKIIGGQKRCSDATGEYLFYKTKTITSFGMIVKPYGGRELRNRCDELNNAYQCIPFSRE